MFKRSKRSLGRMWAVHTFKREFAMIAFLVWVALTARVFFYAEIPTINALNAVYSTASTSIWLFILSAFGMDFAAKQMWDKGGSSPNYEAYGRSGAPSYAVSGRPRLSPGGGRADER